MGELRSPKPPCCWKPVKLNLLPEVSEREKSPFQRKKKIAHGSTKSEAEISLRESRKLRGNKGRLTSQFFALSSI